jgi:hypothetical protein
MSFERVRELLQEIRDFDHTEECFSSAPVYECCCFGDRDQSTIAEEALKEFDLMIDKLMIDKPSDDANLLDE